MSQYDVFPRRNLPGNAEQWGRAIEDAVRTLGRRTDNQELASDGQNRAAAGQLGVVGRQIDRINETVDRLNATVTRLDSTVNRLDTTVDRLDATVNTLNTTVTELQNRKTLSTSPAALSVSGNATVPPLPSATRNFSFTAPNVRRAATLIVSATFSNSNNAHTARAFVEILFQGVVILRWDGAVPGTLSSPPGWAETMSVARSITVPSGTNPAFTIRMYRLGFTSTSTTLTMENISASLQYGDQV